MPRVYKLNYCKGTKYWFRYVDGKKIYLQKAKNKGDLKLYKIALKIWNQHPNNPDNQKNTVIKKKINKDSLRVDKRGLRPKDTIVGLCDLYLAFQQNRANNNEITQSRIEVIQWALKHFIKFCSTKAFRRNNSSDLNSQRLNGYKKRLQRYLDEDELSEKSANMLLAIAKQLIWWCYFNDLIKAEPKFTNYLTPFRERTNKQVKVYSIDDVRTLYDSVKNWKSAKQLKLWMCLALNCGFTSSEIATLSYADIDFDGGVITKERIKTKMHSRWVLWHLTKRLLLEHKHEWKDVEKIYHNDNKSRELVFQNKNGLPVYFRKNQGRVEGENILDSTTITKADSVSQMFRTLKRRVFPELDSLPTFRSLRALGATELEKLVPEDSIVVARMYLSHSLSDLFSKSYWAIDMKKMDKPLMEMERVFDLERKG